LPHRSVPAKRGNVEISLALDRQLRCRNRQLRGVQTSDEAGTASDHAGDQPVNIKNRELSDKEIDERLAHYKIPTDLPLVVQISRFDPWKDPEGVVKA